MSLTSAGRAVGAVHGSFIADTLFAETQNTVVSRLWRRVVTTLPGGGP
jgi:hypothetical protein